MLKKPITYQRTDNDWVAKEKPLLPGRNGRWESGRTEAEAIGKLQKTIQASRANALRRVVSNLPPWLGGTRSN